MMAEPFTSPLPADSQRWRRNALCQETDPEAFFPPPGSNSAIQALKVCAACDVQTACLNWVMDQDIETYIGVWGGTTHADRKRMIRESKRVAA